MNYEQTRKKIDEAGARWDDFITFMADKKYDIDPTTHYILYPKKFINRFIKHHAKVQRTGA